MQTPSDSSVGASPSLRELEIRHQRVDAHRCVVALDGEVDLASAPALKSALLDLFAEGYRRFVLDLSKVSHMDSTGLGVLIGFQKRLDEDGELSVAAVPPTVSGIFRVTGLDQHFEIFSSLEEALADAPEPPDEVWPSLGGDAALVVGLAATALPFAESCVGEAERWLRVLSRYGDAARILHASGVHAAPVAPLAGGERPLESGAENDRERLGRVVEHAKRAVVERSANEVTTADLLAGVMAVYRSDFDRVLAAYGCSRETVVAQVSWSS